MNELQKSISRLCLAFPETEEFTSHGMPNYRVRGGKVFAMYAVDHHGDGRVALWLNTPDGMQDAYVREEPKHFFVPPYVGPGGWLGLRLDKGHRGGCRSEEQSARQASVGEYAQDLPCAT